jgi:hypothetical protein
VIITMKREKSTAVVIMKTKQAAKSLVAADVAVMKAAADAATKKRAAEDVAAVKAAVVAAAVAVAQDLLSSRDLMPARR